MRAWEVHTPGPVSGSPSPLVAVDRAVPQPGPTELLVRVEACGVCRTDLHVAEGDLDVHLAGVVPGHEIVGTVAQVGSAAGRFAVGDRVGVAWLRHTCGSCRWCRQGRENLCTASKYTGWDADGGYAEFTTVPEAFAYRLPNGVAAEALAPLLCAGIIGYRALMRAQLPPGGRLGIYGFGGSAHLTAQLAIAQGAQVHVFTREQHARDLARRLGASSVQDAYAASPAPLDAAILFAPVGDLVPVALAALGPGGTLAVAGIHLSDVPTLDYQRHLFQERTLTSVTSNTRRDGAEFLALALRLGVRATTRPYPLGRADEALRDLAAGRVCGAAVLLVD